jgi:hypothetical protein
MTSYKHKSVFVSVQEHAAINYGNSRSCDTIPPEGALRQDLGQRYETEGLSRWKNSDDYVCYSYIILAKIRNPTTEPFKLLTTLSNGFHQPTPNESPKHEAPHVKRSAASTNHSRRQSILS